MIGALIGGAIGAIGGALIGGPLGALAGAGVGALAGAIIGGVAGGGGSPAAAVTFPSYSEIIADSGVQSRISAAWTSTEAAANATTRREEGFWVRKNMGTNALECTATVLGPSVGPAETGSTNFGAMPSDTNSGSATAIYIVGLFHTHTPTAFRTAGRGVGPSTADDTVHARIDRVGIIKDYVESPAGSGSIPAGHPIGSPAQLYHSGPDRRQRV